MAVAEVANLIQDSRPGGLETLLGSLQYANDAMMSRFYTEQATQSLSIGCKSRLRRTRAPGTRNWRRYVPVVRLPSVLVADNVMANWPVSLVAGVVSGGG